jgi:hypothetical protein
MPDLIRHPVHLLDSPVRPGNDNSWLLGARFGSLSRIDRDTTLGD